MATNKSEQSTTARYNNGEFYSDVPGIAVNNSDVSSRIEEMNNQFDKESLAATIKAAKDAGMVIIGTTNDAEILQLFIYVVKTGSKFGFNRTVTGSYVNSMIHRARVQIELQNSVETP